MELALELALEAAKDAAKNRGRTALNVVTLIGRRRRALVSPLHILVAVIMLSYNSGIRDCTILEGQGPLLHIEPPARLEFSNSTGARADCVARGSPPPTIKWVMLDGSAVGEVPGLRRESDNGSLIFAPFSAAAFRPDVHRAVYRCVAANALGKVLSRDVRVRGVVMQTFRVEALGATVTHGNTAVIRCQVPAHVRDYITVTSWLQDHNYNIYPSSDGDGKLHMLPTGELVMRSVTPADTASSFQCRVTHRLSGETRVSLSAARLTVVPPNASVPPQFVKRLLNMDVRDNELTVLPCVAEGHPAPEYRWETNGTPVDADENRYVSGGLLVLPRAKTGQSGLYTCEARNEAGTARLEFSLLVSAPLTVRVQPQLLTAALGQPAAFSCTPSGSPVTTVNWMKDGQPLMPAGIMLTLTVPSVGKEDQGMYQCFVKNDFDMGQGTAELRLGDTPPVFAYSFIRQTIQPGPSVSLKCVASGNPTPTIKWTLDGFNLPQNDRFVIGQYVPSNGDVVSHVNITNVHVEDGGTYQCTAANRVGEVSHSAQLNVYGTPLIRTMGNIPAVAGEDLLISCPVAGYPIENIDWFRVTEEGDRIIPQLSRQVVYPNGTLMIEKVQAVEDDGLYRCTAANKQGDHSSELARVLVTVPPKITPFSFRSDLHLGERVGAQCVVSKGDPPLDVHWLKDGRTVAREDHGVMVRNLDEFTSVISIKKLSREHGGNYTCVARNGAAEVSETATLAVNVPPAITPFAFGELSSGERVLVTCSVKRGDPPLTIQWLKDSRPIPTTPSPHDDPDLSVHDTGEFSSVLAIRSVSSRHSGNYTCAATNKARTTSYTAPLLVTVPPTWVVQPQSSSCKIGEEARLVCQAQGFPHPEIIWKRISDRKDEPYRSIVIRPGPRPTGIGSNDPGSVIMQNGTLIITKATKEDEGRYICEAKNGIGVGLSAVLILTVNAPVLFKIRASKVIVKRGTTALLHCQALGDLPITFMWRREGNFLELQGRTSARNVPGGLESELRINEVRADDGGIYTCFARNEFGADQTQIQLLIKDAPHHPTNVRILDKTSRRVSLSWMPSQDGNSPILHYTVRYDFVIGTVPPGVPPEVLAAAVGTTRVQGSQTSAELTGLLPATTYAIRVMGENSMGMGTPSREVLVRTEEEPPEGSPVHLTVDAVSSTVLVVSWEPPPEAQWHGQLLGHYVGHRLIRQSSEGNLKKQYNFSTVTFKGYGRQEIRLEGLAKFGRYGIIAQSYNSVGSSPPSEEVQAQTLEDVPDAPPRDVRCTALSSEALQVSWQPPPEEQMNGIIQGYRLVYEPLLPPSVNEMLQTRTKTTKALTTSLHGLFKYTNYSLSLTAFTRVGDGTKSFEMFCRTQEDVPGPPGNIKTVLISPKTCILVWLPPFQPNGEIIKYNIYLRVVENGRQVDSRSISHLSTSVLQHRYSDLNRRNRYEFWVTALTKVGEGKSTPVAAVTPATKVSPGILSFGGIRVMPWKTDIALPCQSVGTPKPIRQWKKNGDHRIDAGSRIAIRPDGTLVINNLQRSDEGDYTCNVYNENGGERISFQLIVQVPPGTPVLLMTGSSQNNLQLQWKLADSGGSVIRTFALHYKFEHGEWEEFQVEGTRRNHILTGLRCGTRYHVYITANNRVGISDPSATLNVRTRGAVPLRPKDSDLLDINYTSVAINFHSWPDGGCPLLYFVLEYCHRIAGEQDQWEVVGNNIKDVAVYPLVGLDPGEKYKLRITAHNAAGSRIAEYAFATLREDGTADPSLSASDMEYSWAFKIAILIISGIIIAFSIASICFCLKRPAYRVGPRAEQLEEIPLAIRGIRNEPTNNEEHYATIRMMPSSPEAPEAPEAPQAPESPEPSELSETPQSPERVPGLRRTRSRPEQRERIPMPAARRENEATNNEEYYSRIRKMSPSPEPMRRIQGLRRTRSRPEQRERIPIPRARSSRKQAMNIEELYWAVLGMVPSSEVLGRNSGPYRNRSRPRQREAILIPTEEFQNTGIDNEEYYLAAQAIFRPPEALEHVPGPCMNRPRRDQPEEIPLPTQESRNEATTSEEYYPPGRMMRPSPEMLENLPGPSRTRARQEQPEEMSIATYESRMEQAHDDYYLPGRKISLSPEELECIPEYAEDVRPYATFQLAGPSTMPDDNAEETDMQTFSYVESEIPPGLQRTNSRRTGNTRPFEDYDSFGSESDNEAGPSSRTESSNQLDYGRNLPAGNRSYRPPSARAPGLGLDVFPSPGWPLPAAPAPRPPRTPRAPRTHRRSRRNCQAHMLP